jgi:hypothetical protein
MGVKLGRLVELSPTDLEATTAEAIQEAKRTKAREALRSRFDYQQRLLPDTDKVEAELMELRELACAAGRFLNADPWTGYHQSAYRKLSEAYEAWCQNYRNPSSQAWVSGVGEVR